MAVERYLEVSVRMSFGVLHQALQGHSNVDDLCLFVLPAVIGHKLPIPGVEDNQT